MYQFDAALWLYQGADPWHFLTLPATISDEIRKRVGDGPRPFGSVRVNATIGDTGWSTSLFPDAVGQTYLLPVKKSVRMAEHLSEGDRVSVALELRSMSEE